MRRLGGRIATLVRNRRLRLWVESALLIVTLPTALVVVGLHGAPELHLTVVREVREWNPSTPPPQDNVLVFDKTYTDIGVVRQVQEELDGLPYYVEGGGAMGQFDYRYTFSFSAFGLVTQVYSGTDLDVTGRRTLYSVPVSLSPPSFGEDLLRTLSEQIGIPIYF